MRSDTGTWLCPHEQWRERLLENSPRIARARSIASAGVGMGLIWAAPTYGWWMLPVFLLSVVNTSTVELRMRHSERPEYHAAFTMFASQSLLALTAAATGGPRSPLLPLIVVPTAFAATRFRKTVAVAYGLVAVAMLAVVTLGLHPAQTWHSPGGLIATTSVLIGVCAAAHALSGAELQYRKTAVLDPLTGLLNRQGLERRFEELAEQAHMTGAPVSILVCDIDHFKAVNDAHGHAIGDAVLRDVAYALRKQLRSFELIYRIGGEEFLVLLPGATLADATGLAERLCEATRGCRTQGLALTLSVGVSTLYGADLSYRKLFEAADAALYQAKSEGRDRVVSAAPVELERAAV
jgi:diguanylate cyclase (GGDEF)-like protein